MIDPARWVDSIEPDFDHAPTIKVMRSRLVALITDDETIRAEVVACNGEEAAREIWDAAIGETTQRNRTALAQLDAHAAALGIATA